MPVKKIGYANYRIKPLEQITRDAKKIRKAKPSMTWQEAIKQASKDYNSRLTYISAEFKKKKVAGVKKVTARALKPKKPGAKIITGKKPGAKVTDKQFFISRLISTSNELDRLQKQIESKKNDLKTKGVTSQEKIRIRQDIRILQTQFASLKVYFNTIAKFR